MNEHRRLGSWTILPHDDSKVVAPYRRQSSLPTGDSRRSLMHRATLVGMITRPARSLIRDLRG